jgi:hypothetical protein
MSKTTTAAAGLLLAGLVLATDARADEWDQGASAVATDNTAATPNAMFHGSQQVHDLAAVGGVQDEDWYLVASDHFSSYEFAVDGLTGQVGLNPVNVQRLDANGAVLENGLVGNFGGVLTLRWFGPGNVNATRFFVRIHDPACGTGCDSQDRYHARFYDTTYTVPRFNNSGTQTTVLVLQNAAAHPCAVTIHYFPGAGSLLQSSQAGTVNRRQSLVVNTASAVPNQSGTVRVAHTCGYGGLTGKAVSIEPSTGFTFDTQLLHRPH